MNKLALTAGLAAFGLLAGCSLFRWSGYDKNAAEEPGRFPVADIAASTASARAYADLILPEVSPERRRAALFYSDLGPDTVDVSAYPPARKREYEAYARACSRCHTLARSINAPYASRAWWEFYIASMRVRSHFHGDPLSSKETKAVLDFLEYDSKERKVARAAEFELVKAELKRRFDDILDERMERLQNNPLPGTR